MTRSEITGEILAAEAVIRAGGGAKAIARQHAKGRLTARQRVMMLVDGGSQAQGDAQTVDPLCEEILGF